MLKRIMAVVLTIVLFCGGIMRIEPAYARETTAGENVQSAPESGINIATNSSFGSLLSDALQSKMDDRESDGYRIFSVEVQGSNVSVSYEAMTSATIVVGIYDETGMKLLNFGSAQVIAEETEVSVNLETEEFPQYFYVRIFFVDTKTLRPLCNAYETPDYTREMQDLFESTTEDYKADRVLNLDDDITNNFAVYEDATKIIIADGKSNQLITADTAAQSYVFENADEEITSLKEGDIFAYRSDGEDLIVKAGAVYRDGATVTIQGAETTMDEVFANVKINAGQTTSELDMSQAVCGEGVTYLGKIEEDAGKQYANGNSRKIDIADSVKLEDEYHLEKKDESDSVTLSGTIKAGMGISVTAYITRHHQKIEFTVNESLHMDLTALISLKEEITLFTVPFSPIPAIKISVSLAIPVEVNAKITVAVDVEAQQGFSYDADAGFQSLANPPDMKAYVEIEGKLYVGLRLRITGSVLNEELLSLSLYGEVGEEFSASNAKKEDSDSVKHDCRLCLDGDITLRAGLYAELNIIKIIDNKVFPLLEKTCHQGDFYYCIDKNEFGWRNCPYRRFKVTFAVRDVRNLARLEGAKVNRDKVTDMSGNAVCYLPSGNYEYPIELNGYQTNYQEFSVEDAPKKQICWLKKDGSQEKPDNPDDDKDYMKAYYEILDMFYYKISTGWEGTEDVSSYWYREVCPALSEAGYCLKDLDGNGIPELFVLSLQTGKSGVFEDLYTYIDGKVIHLASSGMVYYALRDDNTIYYDAGYGAERGDYIIYHLDSDKQRLVLNEVVAYENGIYYYGTEKECGDDYEVYDCRSMKIISEKEGREIEKRFRDKMVNFDLTLFDTYTPKGDTEKPNDFTLKNAFREIIGSENELYFRADDYDNNGTREAFGITGNYEWYGSTITSTKNIKVYFINHNGEVSCLDDIEELWYDKTDFEVDKPYLILDTGQRKFLKLGDEVCLPAALYGVKGDSAYQPEVSGKHAIFHKNEDGTYFGDLHEGSGYRYIYEYNPSTGEFDNIGREWVGGGTPQSDDANAETFFKENAGENMFAAPPTITENPDSGIKTAVFTDLLPNEQYNFYIMRSREDDNKFSPNNLFYIRQSASDEEGRLSIEYAAEHIPDGAETFVVGRTRTDLSGAQVSIPDLAYNGTEQYVKSLVVLGKKQLIEGTDYELSGAYSASKAGSYRVAISGIGIYTGVVYADYQIVDAHQDINKNAMLVQAKNKAKKELFSYRSLADYREAQKREVILAIGRGRNAIDYAKDEAGVKKALSDAKVDIDRIKANVQLMEEEEKARIHVSKCKTVLFRSSYIYDGRKKEPVVIVNAGKTELKKNKDYTVLYRDNVEVGMASAEISGIGKYTGKIVKKFKISPRGTSIIGNIAATSRGFTVRWRRQKKCMSGYQIQYSTNRKFTKKTTITKTVARNSATKQTFKKLKARKKYYVRIRTYKTVKGKKYYSVWSKKKSVMVGN